MNTAALFLGLAVSTLVLAAGLLMLTWFARVREARLQRRYLGQGPNDDRGLAAERSAPWLAGMADSGERIDRLLKNPQHTRLLLAQAGWRDAGSRAAYHALQFALPVGLGLVSLALFGMSSGSGIGLLLVLMMVIVGLLAPRQVLRLRARRRRERIRGEVALFINLLLLLFEAGLNLRQALATLARDGGPTMPSLVDELAPLMRQIESGADAERLLFETGRLLGVEELATVFGILRQVERYGGEVREPLLATLDELQSKRAMTLREQVNVMSSKMTVVLVLCFLPPLLIFIAGPALMSISATLGGL